MTKHFYFFRHGQSIENQFGKILTDGTRAPLTDVGLKQAESLSNFLADKKLQVIFSSPFIRAINTAKIVAQHHKNAKIITNDILREAPFGFWQEENPEKQKRISMTFEKIKEFMQEIVLASHFEHIAIASHGGITRALCWFAGYKIGKIKNCQCFHFAFDEQNWHFIEEFETGIEVDNISDKQWAD